ncbi:hypothetical protein C8A03DRAFT_48311 [Achaetomium macrosporum]|uniref:Uncharacterized protein n=1 Tax=Achaetomium macrosporum TaxID=79813 RepID=A0AAN7C0D5_9PEZI|nr:hypothetical protein C8A03DRAFT_48311 [Achaetomium macrosporum]
MEAQPYAPFPPPSAAAGSSYPPPFDTSTLPYRPAAPLSTSQPPESQSYYYPAPPTHSQAAPAPPAQVSYHASSTTPGPPPPPSLNNPNSTYPPAGMDNTDPNGHHYLMHAPPIPMSDSGTKPPTGGTAVLSPAPAGEGVVLGQNHPTSLREARSTAVSALREYIALGRQRTMVNGVYGSYGDNGTGTGGKVGAGTGLAGDVEERLHVQKGVVLRSLRGLQERVGEMMARAEGERWRRFFIGGVCASFIPLVKRLFRRPRDEHESSNRTEYAFKKSKGLISRILSSTHRPGLGSLAFFVFAVLYIFQNEVSLRVAKTVSKRLRRLVAKIEDGREALAEHDVKTLEGWRWRVLMWSD